MADIQDLLLAAFEVEHREHIDAIRATLERARGGEAVDMREIFRRAHSLKGAARAVGLPEIEEAAHAMEAEFARIMEAGASLDAASIGRASALTDAVERQARLLYKRDEPKAADAPAAADAAPAEFLRINAASIQALSNSMHQLSASLDIVEQSASGLRDLEVRAEALARILERGERIDPVRLAAEARAVSRGLTAGLRAQRDAARTSINASARVREEIDRVALAPASTVFAGLEGMLRDMAAEAGRTVDVRIDGLDTQADRALLQAFRDPVIHLLRNAIAHGIETPAERRQAGKPEAGEVSLVIGIRAGRLELSVLDDGRGPDLARIEAAAIQRNLLPARREGDAAPSPERLLALVFEAGLSTAPAVDRVSGRGMGLSVVAEAARRAGGSVALRRRYPSGAEVRLSAPLSSARQPVLLVDVGGETYGLPTHALDRVLHAAGDRIETIDARPFIKFLDGGNQIIAPLVFLDRMLGAVGAGGEGSEIVNIAVLRQGEQRLGVVVENLRDVRMSTISALAHPDVRDLVQGAIQLQQDQAAIVLNPAALFQADALGQGRGAVTEQPAIARTRARRTILVVDDSVTTRTLEKSILEANGFSVVLAVDGLDGLEKLRTSPSPVDLIVADVEMPHMDGFQLLAALKSDSRYASTPIIMMTSRASPEDIQRGMELGADAYLVKQTFDQRELLDTIGQLL